MTEPLQWTSTSLKQTLRFGEALAAHVQPGDTIALIGPLGAGKTQLVRGLATGLGADARQVCSPTFVLLCEYEAATPVIHIDAYRIGDETELETIGWPRGDWADDPMFGRSVCVIEWADRITDQLPDDRLVIQMNHIGETTRTLTLTPRGSWLHRCDAIMAWLDISAYGRSCPICGRAVNETDAHYPFCSERCRLVDLNHWFEGYHNISRPLEEEDFDTLQ